MAYWLAKSEPDCFSWQELQEKGSTVWDGVRNYAARNNLASMKVGDQVLFYHSLKGLEVVGVMRVTKEAFPDPTADDPRWVAVEMVPDFELKKPVSLKDIKAVPALANMQLVRQGRLSVTPVTDEEYRTVMEMAK